MSTENKSTEQKGNELNPLLPAVLDYFGTDLDSHGHYFWLLTGNKITKMMEELQSGGSINGWAPLKTRLGETWEG